MLPEYNCLGNSSEKVAITGSFCDQKGGFFKVFLGPGAINQFN